MSVSTQILFPTEKITRLPLAEWAESANYQLDKFNNYCDVQRNSDDFATILNQIPLIISFTGDFNQAAKICMDTISFYGSLYEKTGKEELLVQSIQNWINLGRLDRIKNNYQEAIKKFIFLHAPDPDEISDELVKDLSKIIVKAINMLNKKHSDIKNIVNFCKVVEPAVTLLKQEDYQNLLSCYPLINRSPSTMSEHLICEVQLIALMSSQKYNQARHYLENICRNVSKNHYHLFLYRNAELAFLTNEQLTLVNCLGKLRQVFKKIDVDNVNHNAINFILAYATLLYKLGQSEQAFDLVKICYDRYQAINDEVGQIQTLKLLILYSQKEEKNFTEKLQKLNRKTGYQFLLPTNVKNEFSDQKIIDSLRIKLEYKLIKVNGSVR